MDGVLPPRGVEQDLPVPGRLRLAPGGWLDPAQAPRDLAEGVPPPLLRRRMAAQGPGTGVVQRRAGHHDPVSLPGIGDPLTLAARRGMRTRHGPDRDLRRARCGDDSHGGFGRRSGETGWPEGQYRAPGRPYSCARCRGCCSPIPTASTTLPFTTTGCCWGYPPPPDRRL